MRRVAGWTPQSLKERCKFPKAHDALRAFQQQGKAHGIAVLQCQLDAVFRVLQQRDGEFFIWYVIENQLQHRPIASVHGDVPWSLSPDNFGQESPIDDLDEHPHHFE